MLNRPTDTPTDPRRHRDTCCNNPHHNTPAARLCPKSPTYWRNQPTTTPPSPTEPTSPACLTEGAAVTDPNTGISLDLADALRNGRQTYTADEVAQLVHAAYESGRDTGRWEYDAMLAAELCNALVGGTVNDRDANQPPRARAVAAHNRTADALERRRNANNPKVLAEVAADRARTAAAQRAHDQRLIAQAHQSQPLWTDWRQVHADVTPAVWRTVWDALAEPTRRSIADLHPDRAGRHLFSTSRKAAA